MWKQTGIAASLLALGISGIALAQNRAMPARPERPGLAAPETPGGGEALCTLKGVYVTEASVVITCFRKEGSLNHFAAVLTPEGGGGAVSVLAALLDEAMIPQGFSEEPTYQIIYRTPTAASEAECVKVMGTEYKKGSYSTCLRAIAIGRGFK